MCRLNETVNVFDGISALLDSNLLRQQETTSGQPRFGMLATIREHALEQLIEIGEDETLRQRHAAFFANMAAESGPKLFSGESSIWLDRLEDDYGNFRATLDFAQATPQFQEMGWRLMLDVNWFWYRRSYLNEARQWYTLAVEQTAALGQKTLRAHILNYAGLIAMWQSDLQAAAQLMDESVRIVRAVGDDTDLATVLFPRGVLAINQGQAEQALQIFEEALPLFEAAGQEWFQAMIHLHLGNIALSRRHQQRSRPHHPGALLRPARGDRWIVASAVNNFGELARYQDDTDDAEQFYLESRELFEQVQSATDVARANHSLAWIALSRGNQPGASTLCRVSDASTTAWGQTWRA